MPHIALTYWTFSGSSLTWVSSLLCTLAPPATPLPLFSFVGAIVPLMVISSPCSTPLWMFMKALRRSTPLLFSNSSASLPSKIWASQEDVYALEDCLRQALMNLPLPQALDFLHSQLLSSMCISPPVGKDNNPPAPFASPPLKRHFQWPSGTPDPPPSPPSFHVWITWRWLTSFMMLSHGHVFAGVPQGNINSVSIPVTSSNLLSLPLKLFLHNPGFNFSPLPSTSLRWPSKVALSLKTRTRSAILALHRSLNSWASFCRSFCTTLFRSPGVRALRPSHMPSTSFVSLYWTASTPPLKLASCPLSPFRYLFSSRSLPFQAFSNISLVSRFTASLRLLVGHTLTPL